eukprot:SAG31_NODE_27170_length_430_cov_0.927492_1_plen_55_part_01
MGCGASTGADRSPDATTVGAPLPVETQKPLVSAPNEPNALAAQAQKPKAGESKLH